MNKIDKEIEETKAKLAKLLAKKDERKAIKIPKSIVSRASSLFCGSRFSKVPCKIIFDGKVVHSCTIVCELGLDDIADTRCSILGAEVLPPSDLEFMDYSYANLKGCESVKNEMKAFNEDIKEFIIAFNEKYSTCKEEAWATLYSITGIRL